MRWLFVFAMVVVSTSAFLVGNAQKSTSATTNAVSGNRLPDMNLVMQIVRQILALLIPKLMANPNLMAALAGGNDMPPPRQDFGPPMMGGGPGMGMRPMSPGFAAMGDKFKDMRMFELLQSPRLNLMGQPFMRAHFPGGHMVYGQSLPDIVKEQLMYHLHSQQMRGQLPPEGVELLHLVGDIPRGPSY